MINLSNHFRENPNSCSTYFLMEGINQIDATFLSNEILDILTKDPTTFIDSITIDLDSIRSIHVIFGQEENAENYIKRINYLMTDILHPVIPEVIPQAAFSPHNLNFNIEGDIESNKEFLKTLFELNAFGYEDSIAEIDDDILDEINDTVINILQSNPDFELNLTLTEKGLNFKSKNYSLYLNLHFKAKEGSEHIFLDGILPTFIYTKLFDFPTPPGGGD